MDEKTLKTQLTVGVRTFGGQWKDWYIGITGNINQRIKEHRVLLGTHPWLVEIADSLETARSVEGYFVSRGCECTAGRQNDDGLWVYMYKRALGTNP